jgi:hypothetical protein
VDNNIRKLGESLGHAVEESVAKRLPALLERAFLDRAVASPSISLHEVELQVHKTVGQNFKELIMPLVHEHCVNVASHISGLLDPMDSKINKGLRFLLQEIDELKACPQRVGFCDHGGFSSPLRSLSRESPQTHKHANVVVSAGPTCTEFLKMAASTRLRLPHIPEVVSQPLCLRDATPDEWVHLIHLRRQEWGRHHMLGPYSVQQAVCLHMACKGGYSDTQMQALEEIAKAEDAKASPPTDSSGTAADSYVDDRASPHDKLFSHKHTHSPKNITSHSGDSQMSASNVPMSTRHSRKLG